MWGVVEPLPSIRFRQPSGIQYMTLALIIDVQLQESTCYFKKGFCVAARCGWPYQCLTSHSFVTSFSAHSRRLHHLRGRNCIAFECAMRTWMYHVEDGRDDTTRNRDATVWRRVGVIIAWKILILDREKRKLIIFLNLTTASSINSIKNCYVIVTVFPFISRKGCCWESPDENSMLAAWSDFTK